MRCSGAGLDGVGQEPCGAVASGLITVCPKLPGTDWAVGATMVVPNGTLTLETVLAVAPVQPWSAAAAGIPPIEAATAAAPSRDTRMAFLDMTAPFPIPVGPWAEGLDVPERAASPQATWLWGLRPCGSGRTPSRFVSGRIHLRPLRARDPRVDRDAAGRRHPSVGWRRPAAGQGCRWWAGRRRPRRGSRRRRRWRGAGPGTAARRRPGWTCSPRSTARSRRRRSRWPAAAARRWPGRSATRGRCARRSASRAPRPRARRWAAGGCRPAARRRRCGRRPRAGVTRTIRERASASRSSIVRAPPAGSGSGRSPVHPGPLGAGADQRPRRRSGRCSSRPAPACRRAR